MANLLKWVQGVGRQEALRTMGGNVGSDGRRRRVHAAGQDEGTAGIRARRIEAGGIDAKGSQAGQSAAQDLLQL